jgi:glycosyltransferase involved in cell wall biosynthesis
MFSVVILTLNEAENLPRTIGSIAGSDEIVVVDSGSTDGTQEVAAAAGARVLIHPFETFAAQRNHAHRAAAFKNAWVLHLDADEQMTPELAAECAARAAENPADVDGYYIAPQMMFEGRWIPHCTDFPAYQARFVHRDRFQFIQVGHGQREASGMRMGKLRHSYRHDLSSHGLAELEAKHRRYARQEAEAFVSGHGANRLPLWRRLTGADGLTRRRAIKEASRHLPAAGAFRFLYQYAWRRGFLDGAAGYRYCRLMARYESWISAEIRRLRRQQSP